MTKPMSMNQLIANDPKRLKAYQARVSAANKSMDRLGRGTRAACGFALEIAPTSISRVLNGKRVSLITLERIEDWLKNKEVRND